MPLYKLLHRRAAKTEFRTPNISRFANIKCDRPQIQMVCVLAFCSRAFSHREGENGDGEKISTTGLMVSQLLS